VDVPDRIRDLCQALLRGLHAAVGEKLYGVYLYGALAFPEGGATADVDFHAILEGPLTDREKSDLNDLHATLAREFPPLGAELDGYYILLAEARGTAPPHHQVLPGVVDNSWALHRAHIRAGRYVRLYGPDPEQIYPPASWPELATDLQGELDYVENHLDDYPAYCVLNLCRLIYSFQTRDVVVSKRASAAWAIDTFPQWQPLIAAATRSYEGRATSADRALLAAQVEPLFDFACRRIEDSRNRAAGP
jgi:hypothetical protein